ncbi:MAG: FAD-dependent oxidoreductase, partial [bacterium]|nr:FAD-dependent oxidoreductase [bacterium]
FETVKSLSQIYRGDEVYKGEEGKDYEGCGLCAVEVKGTDAPLLACNTIVTSPLDIRTDSASLSEIRRGRLARILIDHPHTCLQCAQREGCSLTQCSSSVKEEERCCTKFGACELRKVSEYVGIKQDIYRYIPQGLKIIQEEPLFKRDFNLCIGCTRCIRACKELRGVDALGLTFLNGKAIVGSKEKTLTSSECKFCGACVEVCPTGALTDKDLRKGRDISLIPCKYTCPANIDVPKYIRLIHQGQYEKSLFSIRDKVPLPSVLGRICNHPCETLCRRGEVNEPIAICLLKRFASEWDQGEWKKELKEPLPTTGKRIAIIGAGPAGLTAAYYLKRKGHQVTIFDAQPDPGGMLRFGIPPYRL